MSEWEGTKAVLRIHLCACDALMLDLDLGFRNDLLDVLANCNWVVWFGSKEFRGASLCYWAPLGSVQTSFPRNNTNATGGMLNKYIIMRAFKGCLS